MLFSTATQRQLFNLCRLFQVTIILSLLGQSAVAQLAFVNVGNTNVGVISDLKISGNYAFLANGGTGMRIYL